jgi:hypothetical protein
MRIIVPESLDESIVSNLKDFFKKIGKYFMATFKGEQIPVMSPVNIGLLYKEGKLPKCVIGFYPSQELISEEPSLGALKNIQSFLSKFSPFKPGKFRTNEALISQTHPDTEMPNVTEPELMRRIRMAIRAGKSGVPLLIWGTPGVAKTAIVEKVLRTIGHNGTVIPLQLSTMNRDDWFLPRVVTDEFGFERAEDMPKTWLPVYKKTGIPDKDAKGNDYANRGNGGILFLDELSRANKAVTATLLTLVNERHMGEWYLGDKWVIISASNRQDDDPSQPFSASTALSNRFSQINFVSEFKHWKQWATHQKIQDPANASLRIGQWKKMIGDFEVDPRILDFIEFNIDKGYALDNESAVWPSWRTWTNTSKNINAAIDDETDSKEPISFNELTKIIASDVGSKAATEFMTFMRLLQTFTQEDIKKVLDDPLKAKMPAKAGKGYEQSESNALISVVCSYTKDKPITPKQWENYNTYLVRLDNGSLAAKGHKMMITINDATVTAGSPEHINSELGEADDPKTGKKKDRYLKGYEIFVEKYGDIF